jgi:putative ABC transport system substrate-binding protein
VFGKFMQYLKALIPEMARLAILLPEGGTASAELAGHLEVAARAAGVEPSTSLVRTREEIVSAFATMQKRGILAAHCFARTGYFERHEPLVRLALDSRVALVDTEPSSIVRAGALMSYTAVIDDLPQRVAAQLEKVLRGMAVRDIPFEQFSKYALQINRTTAKALGITIPPDLMLRADEVID